MSQLDPLTTKALELADEVGRQIYLRFQRRIPRDDLFSVARSTAVEAAQQWNGQGSFAPFVVQRIRWGVFAAIRVRRRIGPRPTEDALRAAAGSSAERAADAKQLDEQTANVPVTIATTESFSTQEQSQAMAAARVAAFRDLLGRAAAAFTVELDSAEALAVVDESVDVEAEAERNRVRRAVGALPPEQRVVVERHDYGGETFEEIADAEKVHRSTVFSRYSRALESLRRTLAPSEGD